MMMRLTNYVACQVLLTNWWWTEKPRRTTTGWSSSHGQRTQRMKTVFELQVGHCTKPAPMKNSTRTWLPYSRQTVPTISGDNLGIQNPSSAHNPSSAPQFQKVCLRIAFRKEAVVLLGRSRKLRSTLERQLAQADHHKLFTKSGPDHECVIDYSLVFPDQQWR